MTASATGSKDRRIIIPIVYQPSVDNVGGGSSGLGDFNPTFFLSPLKPGRFMWGVGPTFLFRTATQQLTGTEKSSCFRPSNRNTPRARLRGRADRPAVRSCSTVRGVDSGVTIDPRS
jgi:hypothetical protein